MTTTEPSSIPSLASLHTLLHECMAVDRFALTRTLRGVDPSGSAEKFSALVGRIEASHLRYCERRDSRPQISYDPALPVARERDSVAQAIDANQVVIICGETGSGKTTQLPKICLELGRGTRGLIAHTQPRRIAARTVAARIASELSTPLGELVGYQVRFVEQFSERSLVKVMTDGVLLAELARDRFLNAYDTIIIDEAHERTLNIDFILGYLQRLVRQRPDLKVIVTSATIDPERFSKHFGGAPIVEVSGRGYPVEVRYRPPGAESEDINTCIVDAVREAGRVNRGDVLVFLPGEREIRDAANTLRRQGFEDTDILPLYARLSLNQQAAIFRTSGRRRIVLATNVAETSVTVPNIRFVVDTGVARISRYSFRSKVQGLPVESVSQASADQRKGRCGRIAPGVCFRLYGEEEFASREAFTEPEIRRTNLAAVILQMKALKLGAPDAFPFIDPPDKRFVRDAYRELRELGAVDAQESLTLIGRRLARLPLDPRLGR
ncbi:MAG: ATP-dependent RNA helicase HrpA, partial [Chromatiales bacterium]|nr:ATP-dependent RNA helicase HrpA [Chromatiales bacterium]